MGFESADQPDTKHIQTHNTKLVCAKKNVKNSLFQQTHQTECSSQIYIRQTLCCITFFIMRIKYHKNVWGLEGESITAYLLFPWILKIIDNSLLTQLCTQTRHIKQVTPEGRDSMKVFFLDQAF